MAEPDSYMIPFEPYRGGSNPNHTFENGSKTLNYLKMGFTILEECEKLFYENFCKWLTASVVALNEPVVIAVAPGHAANSNPTGFMHDFIAGLIQTSECSGRIIDGRQQLIRIKDVPKQSQSPGIRIEETHRGTIEIKGSPDNTGKVVIILDDVWTSGCTLRVCKEVMLTTNPKDIKLFAIGKTVQQTYEFADDDF